MENWSTNLCVNGSDKANISRILPVAFYERETSEVARDLLGKVLVVGSVSGRIVETEAYRGGDPASHSSRGETPRSSVMFDDPGVAYVYFIYGMYEMLNFVTEPKGFPGAVLIRALEPLTGENLMFRRRGCRGHKKRDRYLLTSGPGRLCRAMGIRMSHNRKHLGGPHLFVMDDGYRPKSILASPRVGISVGTEKPWRFLEGDNPFVSRVPQNREAHVIK